MIKIPQRFNQRINKHKVLKKEKGKLTQFLNVPMPRVVKPKKHGRGGRRKKQKVISPGFDTVLQILVHSFPNFPRIRKDEVSSSYEHVEDIPTLSIVTMIPCSARCASDTHSKRLSIPDLNHFCLAVYSRYRTRMPVMTDVYDISSGDIVSVLLLQALNGC